MAKLKALESAAVTKLTDAIAQKNCHNGGEFVTLRVVFLTADDLQCMPPRQLVSDYNIHLNLYLTTY